MVDSSTLLLPIKLSDDSGSCRSSFPRRERRRQSYQSWESRVSIKRETVAENTLANLVGAKRGSNSDLEDETANLGMEVESMIGAAKQMCYDYEPARSEVDLRITVDLQADDILYVVY